jgi:sulfatase maturation enzyme AslB (radical SAM superfamily)
MIKNQCLIDIHKPFSSDTGKVLALYNPYTSKYIDYFDNRDILSFSSNVRAKLTKEQAILNEHSKIVVDSIEYKPSSAEIYVELTEACNFNCPGCAVGVDRYERGLTKSLSYDLLLELLVKIFKSAREKNIGEINIKWSGGEPMMPLPFSIIVKTQPKILEFQKHFNIKIRQRILTNGSYLNEDTLRQLDKNSFHFCISLWGLKNHNTLARNPKTPNGSFENIVKGICLLYSSGYSFNIHHVVTPANAVNLPDFITAMWDPSSDTFLAKDSSAENFPIALSLNYLRPQTQKQSEMLSRSGYSQMLEGTKKAFKVIKRIIDKGIHIQPLERLDYLSIYDLCPVTCGSGFNYIAVGPRGFNSCHEGLFNMSENLDTKENIFDLVNRDYEKNRSFLFGFYKTFPELDDKTSTFLALHGGSGCPRNMLIEGKQESNIAGEIATKVYSHIYSDLLNLEYYRLSKCYE